MVAGTNKNKKIITDGPVIILVEPQLPENIGGTARAMLNCGMAELRLVAPKCDPHDPKAIAMATGAAHVLENAKIYDTLENAMADRTYILASTTRIRDMVKTVYTPEKAGEQMADLHEKGEKLAILFGRENSGLNNEEIALCDAVITVPLNPGFASLNLAQAVLLIGYGWFRTQHGKADEKLVRGGHVLAPREGLVHFYDRLAAELDKTTFFRVPEKRDMMLKNLKNIFSRAKIMEFELHALHGVISALTEDYPHPQPKSQKKAAEKGTGRHD